MWPTNIPKSNQRVSNTTAKKGIHGLTRGQASDLFDHINTAIQGKNAYAINPHGVLLFCYRNANGSISLTHCGQAHLDAFQTTAWVWNPDNITQFNKLQKQAKTGGEYIVHIHPHGHIDAAGDHAHLPWATLAQHGVGHNNVLTDEYLGGA